jgi:hypothetical protein
VTDYKVTGLTSLTSAASDDVLLIVDVHDTSTPPAGPGGSDKQITVAHLTALGGDLTGTAAAATVSEIQGTVIGVPTGVSTQYLNGQGSWTAPVASVTAADSSVTVTGTTTAAVSSVPAQLAQRMLCV